MADDRRAFFESLLDGAWPTDAQLLVGNLIVRGFIREVYTTNFDRFIELATALFVPADSPLVVTHEDSLAVGSIKGPVILKLHGDFHETDLANLPTEIRAKYTVNMREKLRRLLDDRALLVVGYGGDKSVVRLLEQIIAEGGCRRGLYWTQLRGHQLRPHVSRLLQAAALKRVIARPLTIDNATVLFMQLHQALDLRLPSLLSTAPGSNRRDNDERFNWLLQFCTQYRTRSPAPRSALDAARPFTRELIPTRLSEQIRDGLASDKRLIFVWGPAGVGKSSAIAQALTAQNLADRTLWFRPFQVGAVPAFQLRSDLGRFVKSLGEPTARSSGDNAEVVGSVGGALVFVDVGREHVGPAYKWIFGTTP